MDDPIHTNMLTQACNLPNKAILDNWILRDSGLFNFPLPAYWMQYVYNNWYFNLSVSKKLLTAKLLGGS